MTRPFNLLHLFVELPVGGAENLLLSVVEKLDPARFNSVVCCIRAKGPIGEEIERRGTPVIVLDRMHKGRFDRAALSALREVIREQSIDLLHSHLYHANLYGRLAAAREGIPAIASIHNTYSGRPKWHRRLINRYLAHRSAALIVGSNDIRTDVLRYDHVPPQLIETLPNSIDLALSRSELSPADARERLGLPREGVVLGSVGRLEEQKGHTHLIAAMALLRTRGLTPQLLLIGEGREGERLKRQCHDLDLEGQVHFLGTRRDLGDIFRAMDIFVMPSLWEGLSLAMLSAMAAGLPVIATRVGGVEEVFEGDRYGLAIPAGSPEALRDAIATLIGQPQLARTLAVAGRQRVEESYSDEAMVERLQRIYLRALNS